VFDSFCELSKVVHQSLYDLYSPTVATTGRDLCNIYEKYLNWCDHIPEALRLDLHSTPAVLFTQYVVAAALKDLQMELISTSACIIITLSYYFSALA
jgi:hypothetical protein